MGQDRVMSTTIYEVLDELRGAATSEADKGSKLEQLMLSYLRTDPVYAEQFSDVWLWQDWPGRDGKHDTGIDLVAVDRITGSNVAIQCKFYVWTARCPTPPEAPLTSTRLPSPIRAVSTSACQAVSPARGTAAAWT